MITPADPLPDDLETAHQLIRELLETLGQQIHLNAKLQHQLEQLLRQRYGRKSERIDPAQLLLFAQEILRQAEPEPHRNPTRSPSGAPSEFAPAQEGPRPQAAARKPAPQASHARRLPRTASVPRLGAVRKCIGSEVREQLEYVPASLVVLEHIRPKYACPDCETNIVIADRLPEPIEKGIPGLGLMAHVITNKYADHLPLYRQEGILLRLRSRDLPVDLVRLDGHRRRVASADRDAHADQDPGVRGRPE